MPILKSGEGGTQILPNLGGGGTQISPAIFFKNFTPVMFSEWSFIDIEISEVNFPVFR